MPVLGCCLTGPAELCENHTPANFFVLPGELLARMAQRLSKNHRIPELTANRELCASPRTCLVFNDNLYYYFKIKLPAASQPNIECVNRNSPHSQTR